MPKSVPGIQVGEFIEEQIESLPIGRIGAMTAKQVILQKIRDAEREMLLNEFMACGEKIFTGTVKRMDKATSSSNPVVSKAACVAAR